MARRRVVWTDTARADLEEIISYIADHDAGQALAAMERLQLRFAKLREYPQRGRIVPEPKQVDVLTYRELIEGPWRIIYRYEAGYVYVVALLDGRRSLTSLLLERLVR